MKRIYLLSILTLLSIYKTNAQQTLNVSNRIKLIANLPNLSVGDSLPNFLIPKIINADKSSAKTSDFKDQLLIIDFWSIYCSGCVEGLPKMEALQKQFGDKIKILPVTYEPENLVSSFWNRNRNTKNLKLSSVVEDQLFSSYFRHLVIPHEIWIYKGKIIAITIPQYVDENNIKKVLDGEIINWPIKNDFYDFNGTKQSLFRLNKDKIDSNNIPLKYVAITNYKEGVRVGFSGGRGIERDAKQKTIRAWFLNQSIYTSYLLSWLPLIKSSAMVKPLGDTPNQVAWEVANKSTYLYDPKIAYQEDWIRANGICFESLNPDTGQTDMDVSKSIISDLNYFFDLNVRWEKRKEKVLTLIRTTKEDKLKSRTTIKDSHDQLQVKGTLYQFRGALLSTLIYKLNQQAENPYVFDETKYPDKIDIDLNIPSWTDITAIRNSLIIYGLDLKEEELWVDKFVFSEVNKNQN